eukprot:1152144-Pelagomonas_calceolata.AAC.1
MSKCTNGDDLRASGLIWLAQPQQVSYLTRGLLLMHSLASGWDSVLQDYKRAGQNEHGASEQSWWLYDLNLKPKNRKEKLRRQWKHFPGKERRRKGKRTMQEGTIACNVSTPHIN